GNDTLPLHDALPICQGKIPFEVTDENISRRALACRISKRRDVRRQPSRRSKTSRQDDRELQRFRRAIYQSVRSQGIWHLRETRPDRKSTRLTPVTSL